MFSTLLQHAQLNCLELKEWLDNASEKERHQAILQLKRHDLKRLFEASENFLPLDVGHFTGEHFGINNLPMSRTFKKVFYRTPYGRVAGRNVQALEVFSGPGYFSVETSANGEIIFDYRQLPEAKPEGWPTIKSNARGFSFFIFRDLRDVMRGLSKHVTIGRAYRGNKALPNYFALVKP